MSVCLSVCLSVGVRKLEVANSCSIVSGDVSNCSYRLTLHPVTSSRLSSAYNFFVYAKNTQNLGGTGPPAAVFISMASDRQFRQRSGASQLGSNE